MQSRDEWRGQRAVQEAEDRLGPNRVIDYTIRLHTVEQDLDHGAAVFQGKPPVVSLGHEDLYGRWDTLTKRWIGPSDIPNPRRWYCTAAARPLIIHADERPDSQLIMGAMGGGKTIGVLRFWTILQALRLAEYAPIEMGVTAPTDQRLEEIILGMQQAMRPEWYSYSDKRRMFRLRCGVTIRCVGTARRSRALGSRIQNWNWAACASEELQDSVEDNSHIDARGRTAIGGRYKRCSGATVKDAPEWRQLLDELKTSGEWSIDRVIGPDNPFVWPVFWEKLKNKFSKRQYQRMVLAMDVSPEDAIYPSWVRELNLRPVPQVGVEDVTAEVIARAGLGRNVHALVGHDPGEIWDVSEILKAYRRRGDWRHAWWVVGEVTTQGGSDVHALELLRLLRSPKFDCNQLDRKNRPVLHGPRAQVRIDPSADKEVLTTLRGYGLQCRWAAYNAKGNGPGKVPKEPGIDVVDRLLCSPAEERWLYVDCDERRKPSSPRLVESFERSKRDERGLSETEKKTKDDLSHWPASLRYAMWLLERPRLQKLREELANVAGRG